MARGFRQNAVRSCADRIRSAKALADAAAGRRVAGNVRARAVSALRAVRSRWPGLASGRGGRRADHVFARCVHIAWRFLGQAVEYGVPRTYLPARFSTALPEA